MLSPEDKQKILEYELYMSRKKYAYIMKEETWKDKLKRWCCCRSRKYDLS